MSIFFSASDQFLLEMYVWPWAKLTILQHDAFTCQKYSKSRPWPTKRVLEKTGPNVKIAKNGNVFERNNFQPNFVGARFALNETLGEDVLCPKRCRPPSHPEWIHC